MSKSQASLKKYSTTFNKDFIGGLTKGTATTKDFGAQLLRAADQAGLGTGEINRMASASGLFSKQQLAAGKASAVMAAKAKEVTQAVKDGTIGSKEAAKQFGELAKEQQVVSKTSTDLIKDFGKFALVAGGAVAAIAGVSKFLSKKIGLAPDLLDQLRVASRGTVDDMTLMSSTATLLAGTSDELGKSLGNATPQLLEIAKAANKLNPSLGTTSHMYESIALGIKRASPLILDNLGLTIKIGDANEAMAKELGKSVDALTAEEKQMALLNATLAAGDNLIAQVGGTTESAADSFEQLEASVANAKDAMAVAVSDGLTPMVKGLADFIAGAKPAYDAYVALHDAMDAGLITEAELVELDRAQADGKIELSDIIDELTRREVIQEAQLRSEGAAADYVAERFTNLGYLADESMYLVEESVAAAKKEVDFLSASMQTYSEKLLFNIAAGQQDTEVAFIFAEALGLVDEKSVGAWKAIAYLTDKYDKNEDGVVSL
ncbi:MAG: hypothetical protein ACYTFW_26950, partial [Planctomycetota bacterium]